MLKTLILHRKEVSEVAVHTVLSSPEKRTQELDMGRFQDVDTKDVKSCF